MTGVAVTSTACVAVNDQGDAMAQRFEFGTKNDITRL